MIHKPKRLKQKSTKVFGLRFVSLFLVSKNSKNPGFLQVTLRFENYPPRSLTEIAPESHDGWKVSDPASYWVKR